MNSKVEFPVFTETNLGTRIAMTVSPEITAGIFKGELERAHVGCFPELGLLSVDAVTVKWNSYFYHLSDLLPLKHVFQGFKGIWLLHVNATLSNKLSDINNNSTQVCKKKRKKKRRKKKPKVKNLPEFEQLEQKSLEPRGNVSSVFEREGNIQHETLHSSKESDFNATAESPCGSFVSVSSIIDRYFTNFIDVDHNGSTSSSEVTPRNAPFDAKKLSFSKKGSKKQTCQRLLPSLLPEKSNSIALENKYQRSEVGERLVVASNNLGSSQSFSSSKLKKLRDSDSKAIVRRLVFEIEDND